MSDMSSLNASNVFAIQNGFTSFNPHGAEDNDYFNQIERAQHRLVPTTQTNTQTNSSNTNYESKEHFEARQ